MRISLLLLCWLLSALSAWSVPILLRGPYLQMANPSALTICWRSSTAEAGLVRFGTTLGALNLQQPGVLTTNHHIRLTDLTPATTYYYEIQTGSTVLSTGVTLHFTTPPVAGSTGPLRFWVLGDPGTGSATQFQVRNAFAPVHAQRPADFWMMLGDNAYGSGTDYEFQIELFNIYPDYLPQLPLWTCIGNHDAYAGADVNGQLPYDKIFVFPTNGECGGMPSGTERYYAWDYANVHFISLDSMTSDRTATGPMAAWLEADLNQNLQPWVIAFWHHPPYSKGSHDSDVEEELVEMRTQIVPILESHGVDLVLNGHSHNYERSYLMDGHYGDSTTFSAAHQISAGSGREEADGPYVKPTAGMSPHEGAVYVVAGSSGQVSGGTLNHPAHFLSLRMAGSLVVDIEDKRLDVKFLCSQTTAGADPTYSDHFTILKSQPPPLPVAPISLAALPTYGSQTVLYWQDLASNESQQSIQLSTDGVHFAQVQRVAPNVGSTTLVGLVAGQTYYAQILATNITGSASSAVISFTQPFTPSPIEIWRFQHWGATTPVDVRANDADPDQDGWVNLLEYALGTSPTKRTSVPSLHPTLTADGELALNFQSQAATDLSYRVEFSSELSSPWIQGFTSSGVANRLGPITVVNPALPTSGHYFGRLKVSLFP